MDFEKASNEKKGIDSAFESGASYPERIINHVRKPEHIDSREIKFESPEAREERMVAAADEIFAESYGKSKQFTRNFAADIEVQSMMAGSKEIAVDRVDNQSESNREDDESLRKWEEDAIVDDFGKLLKEFEKDAYFSQANGDGDVPRSFVLEKYDEAKRIFQLLHFDQLVGIQVEAARNRTDWNGQEPLADRWSTRRKIIGAVCNDYTARMIGKEMATRKDEVRTKTDLRFGYNNANLEVEVPLTKDFLKMLAQVPEAVRDEAAKKLKRIISGDPLDMTMAFMDFLESSAMSSAENSIEMSEHEQEKTPEDEVVEK